ncbi:hypothetical protein E2C01_097029 [Portunus trituberculatus]|uniref:Uncharacterized protein n=2 Tax=Portunus trituberculatus TaxID=210409 RepID=A0A5B7K4M6_PORTR|nr:hypothetical protein [Portunus trituberculatus]
MVPGFWGISGLKAILFVVPPISKPTRYRKPLPHMRKPNLHSDRGQDSNPCAFYVRGTTGQGQHKCE